MNTSTEQTAVLSSPNLFSSNGSNPVSPALAKNIESFHNVLKRMLAAGANVSDLIFSPGRPPQVELTGDLHGVEIPGLERLTPPNIRAMADLMLHGNEQ